MEKKGSWFSKIKRVFTPHSKEKLGSQEAERKSGKEKRKKGFGKLRCGETSSFLPIYREPSSIEKIFGEAERDHNLVFRPPDLSNPSSPSPPLGPASPKPPPSLPRAHLPRSISPKPPDGSKPLSSSASAPPPPASTRVPSQRVTPPIVLSPKPVPQRVASPQAVSIKPPSPRPTSPRGDSPQALPLNPSPRLETPEPSSSPRLETPEPSSPKHPSPRAEPPRLDSPRLPSPKPPPPREEPPRLNATRPTTSRSPSPKAVSPKAVQRQESVPRPEPALSVQHASATKIQATFRGYKARRSFRALKGLARLQGVVKGYNVKRQTVNAMKYMQQVVRVQSQIQSCRIKTLENQAQDEKDEAKWAAFKAGNENWDDSVLTKEERDARSQRKIDAVIKRERYMAYAYSHKLLKNSPKSAQDVQNSGGLSLWWNWGDRQLPLASPVPSHRQPLRDYMQTPTRLSPSRCFSQSSNQHRFRQDNNFDTSTSTSSRSRFLTPSRYSLGRLRGQDSPFKDDDSFASCPPYPRYMAPTVSAKAKVRPNSNPKERVMSTPSVSSETRRMSYPLTQQGLDMFRWNKGSLHMSNNGSQRGPGSPGGVVLEKHKTLKSVGDASIDSTVSMPATVGRKPFNRYV